MRHLSEKCLLAGLGVLSALHTARAQVIPADLMNQMEKPSVVQMEALLDQWKQEGAELILENHPELFSMVERDVERKLHFDYPTWFSLIKDDGANLIVKFEKAFPGATFVFIGRDMSVYADLMESFYRRLGQNDRIKRLGMSTASLDNLDKDLTLSLLRTHGIDFQHETHPIVFVDAISRKGGRQARRILNSLYQYYQSMGVPASEAFFKANLIGMRVATTELEFTPLSESVAAFRSWKKFKKYDSDVLSFNIKFMMFEGINRGGKYLNSTEVGYVHWVGAWRGSYGAVSENDRGQTLAQPGELLQEPIRENYLKYSIKIVEFGKSDEFLNKVQERARQEGFEFSAIRSTFVSDPFEVFEEAIKTAKGWAQVKELTQAAQNSNLGRAPLKDFASAVVLAVKEKSWPLSDAMKDEMESALPELLNDRGWKKLAVRTAPDDLSYVRRFREMLKGLLEKNDPGNLEKTLNRFREEAYARFKATGHYNEIRSIYLDNFREGDSQSLVLVQELLKEESSFTNRLALVEKYKNYFGGKVDGLLASFRSEIHEHFKNDTEWVSLTLRLLQLRAPDALLSELFQARAESTDRFEVFAREAVQMRSLLGGRGYVINSVVFKTTTRFFETEHPDPIRIRTFINDYSDMRDILLNQAIEVSLVRRDDLSHFSEMIPNLFMRSDETRRAIATFKERTKDDSFWNRLLRGEIDASAPVAPPAPPEGTEGLAPGTSCTRSLNDTNSDSF